MAFFCKKKKITFKNRNNSSHVVTELKKTKSQRYRKIMFCILRTFDFSPILASILWFRFQARRVFNCIDDSFDDDIRSILDYLRLLQIEEQVRF